MDKWVYPIGTVVYVWFNNKCIGDSLLFLTCFIYCIADPTIPNVQVTRLTLMCDQAPGPITMDLTGESHKKN